MPGRPWPKTGAVSQELWGSRHPARRETVNVVVTAVLLAGLVCLLIMGSVGGGPGAPADPRPSVRPPVNGSHELTPSQPAATAAPAR